MSEVIMIDDETYEEWMRSIHGHPVLSQEYLAMQQIHLLLQREGRSIPSEVRFGRLYQQIYRPSDYSASTIDRMFRRSSTRLKSEDRFLIEKYASGKVERLKSESGIRFTFDPLRLINVTFGVNGDDHLSRQRRVLSLQQYIMTRLLLDIDQTSSEIDVGEQFEELLATLSERLFNKNESSPLNWAARLQVNRNRMVAEARYRVNGEMTVPQAEEGFEWRLDRTYCRFMDGEGGEAIPVILDDRVKDDMSTALKVVRKGTLVTEECDQLAFTLVVMVPEHLAILDKLFTEATSKPPFSIRERDDLFQKKAVQRANPVSSDDFLVIRFVITYVNPRTNKTVSVEVNLQLLRDYLNGLYSETNVRHTQYRFRQLCLSYFRFRYPRFVFGVDFRDDSSDYKDMLADLY